MDGVLAGKGGEWWVEVVATVRSWLGLVAGWKGAAMERGKGGRGVASWPEGEEEEGLEASSWRKREFLEGRRGEAYGYGGEIDAMRAAEFSRLKGTVYLDHAGATLYSEVQLRKCLGKLERSVFSNPHSGSSKGGGGSFEAARAATLSMFNTTGEDYYCVFTSGATASLKLVGESFPWSAQSSFLYTKDNHNSVLGVRNYALDQESEAAAVSVSAGSDGRFDIDALGPLSRPSSPGRGRSKRRGGGGKSVNLFAFPAESNFSGVRYNLDVVNELRGRRCRIGGRTIGGGQEWFVLLDAAKACCTSPPDLSKYPADFVAISFYKIFGYPSGLGALLIRKDSAKVLQRKYYGGGTVKVSVAEEDYFRRRDEEDGWEDGTLPFLSLEAVHEGFEQIRKLSFQKIEDHTSALTEYTAREMDAMRHCNGERVCEIYGRHTPGSKDTKAAFEVGQGPVIAFNLMRSDSSYVGYKKVETLGEARGIVLRTGCHCNPGACSGFLGLTPEETRLNFESGHSCWDDKDVMNGKPTGAVRISFGYMSTFEDADSFLEFLRGCFLERQEPLSRDLTGGANGTTTSTTTGELALSGIFVYPIKSCQGFRVRGSWPVSESGLFLDRRWAIADESGAILTQKKVREMTQVSTDVDASRTELVLDAPGMVPLKVSIVGGADSSALRERAGSWLSSFLGRKCRLLETSCDGGNFSNQGGCLLVSEESVRNLLPDDDQEAVSKACMRFRPNFLVKGGAPFQEESWTRVSFGKAVGLEKVRECGRCGMIGRDLLDSLNKKRKNLNFGVLLSLSGGGAAAPQAEVAEGSSVTFS